MDDKTCSHTARVASRKPDELVPFVNFTMAETMKLTKVQALNRYYPGYIKDPTFSIISLQVKACERDDCTDCPMQGRDQITDDTDWVDFDCSEVVANRIVLTNDINMFVITCEVKASGYAQIWGVRLSLRNRRYVKKMLRILSLSGWGLTSTSIIHTNRERLGQFGTWQKLMKVLRLYIDCTSSFLIMSERAFVTGLFDLICPIINLSNLIKVKVYHLNIICHPIMFMYKLLNLSSRCNMHNFVWR